VSRRTLWFGLGLAAGAVAGYAWWTQEQEVHQRALYSDRPLRRLAALGWVSGRPGVQSVMLLREYLTWEQNPVLQRRARRLLARFENALA
jgi:hypothetical protein